MNNKQAGGIVSFIIVAVALAGLLAGGLYLSKQQGRTARDTDTSTPQVSTTETKEKSSDEKSTKNESSQQHTESKPEATRDPSQTTPSSSSSSSSSTPSSSSTRTDRVATTGPSAVPSTGPTETVAVSLALGALVFTGYRFLQSRHAFRSSALRQ